MWLAVTVQEGSGELGNKTLYIGQGEAEDVWRVAMQYAAEHRLSLSRIVVVALRAWLEANAGKQWLMEALCISVGSKPAN